MSARRYTNTTLQFLVTSVATAVPDYPATLPGVVMWFDGRAPAYSDTGGTVLAAPYGGRVRRSGALSSGSTSTSGYRETNAVNFQTGQDQYLAPPTNMPAPAVGNVTYAGSFVARDNPPGGPQCVLTALDTNGASNGLLLFGDNRLQVNIAGTGAMQGPASKCDLGRQVSFVLCCGATGWKLSAIVDGVRFDSVSSSYPSGGALTATLVPSTVRIGTASGDTTGIGLHGAVSQSLIIDHALADSQKDALLAWLALNQPAAFAPAQIPCINAVGNSILRGLGLESDKNHMWCYSMLAGLNAVQPVNLVNTALSGSAIIDLTNDYARPRSFLNHARARNVLVVAGATNDMANLGHDGPTALAAYYGYCDQALADGWNRVVVCTVLPRNAGSPFNTARAYFNSHLVAEYAARGYHALANVAAIPGMGADGDDANATYYQDHIHPTAAGNGLLAPVYAAAIQSVLG